MRVLCVAEKPSIAKSITQILSDGRYNTVSVLLLQPSQFLKLNKNTHQSNTGTPFIKNYEFDYPRDNAQFVVTSVAGHLFTHNFPARYKSWHSCDPFVLFDAPIETQVPPVSRVFSDARF